MSDPVAVFDERVFNEGLRDVLRHSVLADLVGLDPADTPKIYRTIAPPNTEPNYIVYHRIAGEPPIGTYGDDQCIRQVLFDIIPWARNRDEAFQLQGAAEEVIRRADWTSRFDPWAVLGRAKTLGDGVELEDRDSRLVSMAVTYQLTLAYG